MSDLNPYPADPYRQGAAGSPYPTDFDRASQSASGVSSTRNGYYSADDLGGQSPHFPAAPGGQMVPYPGGVVGSRTARHTGSPTVSSTPIRLLLMDRIRHMVRACTGGCLTIHVDMRPMLSAGGRSGSVLRVSLRTVCLSA